MAAGYLVNYYGAYEEKDGEVGVYLRYAGIDFFAPYAKVLAVPNWTFREVDHDKSTGEGGVHQELTYQSMMVNGQRVVEELVEKQNPVPFREMGVIPITGKPTGKMLVVFSGCSAEGNLIMSDVAEKEATASEIANAKALAESFKRKCVAEYFQSKRERMTGGKGKNYPDPVTRTYMEELNIEDLDDVTAHAKNAGLNPQFLKDLMIAAMEATAQGQAEALADAVKGVRAAGKAQLSNSPNGRRSVITPLEERPPKPELSQEEIDRRKAIGAKLMAGRKAKQEARDAELATKE